jgi:hypothetical protein
MCVVTAAMREDCVARFLRAYPQVEQVAYDHPALAGCAEVDWSGVPECPAGVPYLLRGLLDEAAGPEAVRQVGGAMMGGPLHLGAGAPAVLPYLIRLAAVPGLAVREELFGLLVFAAMMAEPDDGEADDEGQVPLSAFDRDRRERAACRAVFAAHAPDLRALLADPGLPAGLIGDDDRAYLLRAVEWEERETAPRSGARPHARPHAPSHT